MNEVYYNPEKRIKRCSRCKQWLSYDDFPKNKSQNSGLNRQCKKCCAERRNKRFAFGERPQKPRRNEDGTFHCCKCDRSLPAELFHKDSTRKYGLASICKQCVKKYHNENSEKINAQTVKWQKDNKERYNEYQRGYAKLHPVSSEQARLATDKRVARLNATDNTLTQEEWLFSLEYFHGCCAVCGRQLKDLLGTHTASADHWYPLSKGGATTAMNIIPLCHGIGGCNNRKRNKLPEEWLISEYGKRKAKVILKRIQGYFDAVSRR